jgi:hypothetical protein
LDWPTPGEKIYFNARLKIVCRQTHTTTHAVDCWEKCKRKIFSWKFFWVGVEVEINLSVTVGLVRASPAKPHNDSPQQVLTDTFNSATVMPSLAAT